MQELFVPVSTWLTSPGCQLSAASSVFHRPSFLAGAAEEDHRAGPAAFLEIALHRGRRGQRSRAEQVVPAAVPRSAGHERVRLGLPRGLAKAGERVELAQDADHGLPLPNAPQKAVSIPQSFSVTVKPSARSVSQ